MTPTPQSTYDSGRCKVVTYHDAHHELWFDNTLVAAFRQFRSAVAYGMREFA
jgi:hypothetical protein